MLIHMVHFWLNEDAQDKRPAFEAALKTLIKIDLIQEAHLGQPAKTEVRPVTDNSFDYSLILKFANQADHDAYQVHPDHDVFIDECKELWAKVLVMDTETFG